MIVGVPVDGDIAVVIGETVGHLGQSALLAEAFAREEGDAPHVDLAAERRNGEFLRAHRKHVNAATDLSDGGLALAAFEMAEGAGVGITLDTADVALLFGEDQARYLVAVAPSQIDALTSAGVAAGVVVKPVGRFGGSNVSLGGSTAALSELSQLYRTAFARAVEG